MRAMATTRRQAIELPGEPGFEGTLVLPESGRGPGIVLFQEVFGVGEFLLAKAAELAGLGYVVLCPDVFWRVRPHVALAHDEAALAEAMALAGEYQAIPQETRVRDLVASFATLRSLPETTGRAGVMGYCLGGLLAYLVALEADPDACVSYYGSGVADLVGAADRITCPTLFHFGGKDPYLPADQVAKVASAFEGRSEVTVRIEPEAGHAFENLFAPAFANEAAAARSWPVTVAFLREHLG